MAQMTRIVAPLAGAALVVGGLATVGAAPAAADTVTYPHERTLPDYHGDGNAAEALEIADDGTAYVLNRFGEQLRVFGPRADGRKTKPVREVRGVFAGATDVSVDGKGLVYVLEPKGPTPGTSRVTVLPPRGKGNPLRRLVVPGTWTALGVGPAGHIALAGTSALRVYPPGASGTAEPSQVITGAATRLPTKIRDVGFGGDGRVWAGIDKRLVAFARGADGNTPPVGTIAGVRTRLNDDIVRPQIDLDGRGRVYVIDAYGDIAAFAPNVYGDVAPVRKLAYPDWGFSEPVAVNARGDLIVGAPDEGPPRLQIYRTLFPRRPSVVRSVRVSGKAGAKKRTVRWKKPADDGGRAVRSYRVVIRKGSKVLKKVTLKPGRRSYTVKRSSLRRGKLTVTVRAKTAKGWSPKATKKFRVR
ncbi:hypothetical protein [Mumia quercus]|uniref:hypothetical protein n=1 Tax=Mumia quercus TaxID=2976125 RepID=UPI0021CF2F9B|nr:hypothetical protein [Mumia quercus]